MVMPSSLPPVPRNARPWLIIPVVLLAADLLYTRSASIDDAYISYRYAWNLVNGHGLVFNAGQRVEGISNLLWTLILSGFTAVGIPLPVAGYVCGVASLLAIVLLTALFGQKIGLSGKLSIAAACFTAVSMDLVAGSTMGLEGGLFAALLLASLVLWDGLGAKSIGFGLAVAALAATRPEGIAVGMVLLSIRAVVRREGWVGSLIGFLGIVALEIGRYAYYGSWIPLSVTAKRDVGFSPLSSFFYHAPPGAKYLLLHGSLPLLLAAGAALCAFFFSVRRGSALGTTSPLALPAAATVALGLGLPLLSGGDWMPYARLVTPYLPVATVVVLAVLHRAGPPWIPYVALTVLFMAGVHSPPQPFRYAKQEFVGRALAASDIGNRVIASEVLGRVSYEAPNVEFTDMSGLTEPGVARAHTRGSVYGKRNLPFTMSLQPAVIDVNTWFSLREALQVPHTIDYQAVTSPELTTERIFLLVDPTVAPSFAAHLRSFYPDIKMSAPGAALSVWKAAVPNGQ